jgi:hypothetical protein
MTARNISFAVIIAIAALFNSGCVERKLTINTEPQGALVMLNDEEIGISPVTVAFNWYGDYKVRIQKDGYQALSTHKKLDRPKKDVFPIDFFYEVLWPGRIVDEYAWTFDLNEYTPIDREELLKAASVVKEQSQTPMTLIELQLHDELQNKAKKKRRRAIK